MGEKKIMSNMVDLYVDPDNEFYVVDNGSHQQQLLINIATGNEEYITQSDFIDLRRKMRHYTIDRSAVRGIVEAAERSVMGNLPAYYRQSTWDNFHERVD